jgi:aldehyde dehydrogenase (NAD+)
MREAMPVEDTAGTTATTIADAAPESQVDRRLLIDGRLVTSDRTFPSINPVTGALIGHAPDAGTEQAQEAIAAARRAFDATGWSTDVESRIRCLDQLHATLVEHADELPAEWGADVVKLEHAVTGDPQRGLRQTGMLRVEGDPNPNIEHANRGKAQHRTRHAGAGGQGGALRAGPPVRCVPHQLPSRSSEELRHRRRRHSYGQPEHHLRPRQRIRPARCRGGEGRL